MRIRDQVFIITGGASGLGEACARMIAEQGGKPVIADIAQEAGAALARQLQGCFVMCDVRSEADGQAAIAAAQQMGSLRGLINCAGIAPAARTVGKQGAHALELFQKTVDINLVGSFNMARLAAAAMVGNESDENGERGVIIHTASVAAYDGQAGQAAYAASKAGVAGLCLPMARDLARHGIRVMAIAPGVFETPMMAAMSEQVRASLAANVPFPPRLGKPDEFAALARAILENPMLNGESIRLDGALRMQFVQ